MGATKKKTDAVGFLDGTQAAVDKLGHLAMVQGISGIPGRIPRTRGSVLPFLIEIGSRAAISCSAYL